MGEGTTTVTLPGVSASGIITFRESFSVSTDIGAITVPLGPLFNRFFQKKSTFKTTPGFKKVMASGHALGVEDSVTVKAAIRGYVSVKETKPNVKMKAGDDC